MAPADLPISRSERDRIQRFEAAFNELDKVLRSGSDDERTSTFMSRVRQAKGSPFSPSEIRELRVLNDLRNMLVHERVEPYGYLSIPTSSTVATIERLRDKLLSPLLVWPTFQQDVQTLAPGTSLDVVLEMINSRDFSQFPVVEAGSVRGLLTETGITRWLAHHVSTIQARLDFEAACARDILKEEESENTFTCVASSAHVTEVIAAFASQPLLEAVLVTQNGRRDQELLGIATRWDALRYLDSGALGPGPERRCDAP